ARVIWWGPAGPPTDHCTSAWVEVEPFEYTYTIDLTTAPLETGTLDGQVTCGPHGHPGPRRTTSPSSASFPTSCLSRPAGPSAAAPFAPTCESRPNVSVQSAASGDGRLRVTVTASGAGNPLQALRFSQTSNALIDITGGRTGSTGNFSLGLTPGTLSYTFFLRRATAGQAATAPFTVTDGCGEWPTLAGGGPSAPF